MRKLLHQRLVALALTFVCGSALVAGMSSAPSRAEPSSATARLDLRGELRLVSRLVECPGPGESAGACAARTGEGLVSGLGRVTEAYTWRIGVGPPSCADGFAKTLAYDVVLVVAGKGEIQLALSEGAECVDVEEVRTQAQAFTIIGGTGTYAGASGAGTVSRSLGQTARGAVGVETWVGSLDVPGLEFDVTPPAITGASRKTVVAPGKARRVRVSYRVGARDEVDGAVPVSCKPRSGARFGIGRTIVTCSASDTSGNAKTARFAITVKRRR
jgi:HYR domain